MGLLSYCLRNVSNKVADYLENCEYKSELDSALKTWKRTGNTDSFTLDEKIKFYTRKRMITLKEDYENSDIRRRKLNQSEGSIEEWYRLMEKRIELSRKAFYGD